MFKLNVTNLKHIFPFDMFNYNKLAATPLGAIKMFSLRSYTVKENQIGSAICEIFLLQTDRHSVSL